MSKEQKVGAIIVIGLLVCGIAFQFYSPLPALVLLASLIVAVYMEIAER